MKPTQKITAIAILLLFGAMTLQAQEPKRFKVGNKYGYQDQNGKEIIAPKYEIAHDFKEGLGRIKINGKWAFINKDDQQVLSNYEGADNFSEGLAAVKLNGKYGYIDKKGKEVITAKYDMAGSFHEGIAIVGIGDYNARKHGFIDKTGKEIIPLKYDAAQGFQHGLALVRMGDSKTGKFGFIDKTGKEIIPLQYTYAGSFKDGLAPVKVENKYGYIAPDGKIAIAPKYDAAYGFSEGVAPVRVGDSKSGKWGFIDVQGKEVIPAKYELLNYRGVKNGAIRVKQDDKHFFIDKSGNPITPQYNWISAFSNGIAITQLDNKMGLINESGKVIVPSKYDEIMRFSEGMVRVNNGGVRKHDGDTYIEGGKWGFVNMAGEEVIPLIYDYVTDFYEGKAGVDKDGRKFSIDKTGKEVK